MDCVYVFAHSLSLSHTSDGGAAMQSPGLNIRGNSVRCFAEGHLERRSQGEPLNLLRHRSAVNYLVHANRTNIFSNSKHAGGFDLTGPFFQMCFFGGTALLICESRVITFFYHIKWNAYPPRRDDPSNVQFLSLCHKIERQIQPFSPLHHLRLASCLL